MKHTITIRQKGFSFFFLKSQYKRRRRKTKEGLTLHAIYIPETCVVYHWKVTEHLPLLHSHNLFYFLTKKKAGPFQSSFLKSRFITRICRKKTKLERADTGPVLSEAGDYSSFWSEHSLLYLRLHNSRRASFASGLFRMSWGHPAPHTSSPAGQHWLREEPDPPPSTRVAPALPADGLQQNATIIF